METKNKELHSPERVYSIKAADILMDIKSMSGHFDYSNLGSIYEKK